MTTSLALQIAGHGWAAHPLAPYEKTTVPNCNRCAPKSAPCHTPGAVCRCWAAGRWCHGFRAATSDAAHLDGFWPRRGTGAGVATEASDLVVIDLDTKPLPSGDLVLPDHLRLGQPAVATGMELMRAVWAALGRPEMCTYVVETPSGGRHLYYQRPAGRRYRGSAGRCQGGRVAGLGAGIDIRAAGGYVVAAGSRTTAGMYRVIRDRPVAVLPAWLEHWLTATGHQPGIPAADRRPTRRACSTPAVPLDGDRTRRAALAALRAEVADLAALPNREGSGRNVALNKAAYKIGGYVAAGYLTESETTDALTDAAISCGLGERETTHTIRSGLTAGMQRRRTIGGDT